MRRVSVVLVVMALAVLLALPVNAQTSFTRLSGVVKDTSGGVIPGATVTLTRVDTGASIQTISNDQGAYLFGTLLPGIYELKVELAGFRTAVFSDLRLMIQSAHQQDIILEAGGLQETVTVTATAEVVLQKSDATVGNVIERDRLQRLPNPTRSVAGLLQLQPGTTPTGAVTGSRSDQQTYQLDGIDVSDYVVGATFRTVIPTPTESVEEFRVAVANPDASFGRSAGANVTLVTKRGGAKYHGSGYWYHQNDNLSANSWTNNSRGRPKAELKDNRFGFSVGGPILKGKTFFFANYEGRRLPGSSSITRIVPTESLRNGLLRFRNASGAIQSINPKDFDPRGLGANPAILEIWKPMPLPNSPSPGDGLNTAGFTSDVSTRTRNDYGVLRIDHMLSPTWNLEAKFAADRLLQNTASQVDLVRLVGTTENPARTRNAHIGLNSNLTPRLTNEFRFGWTKDNRPVERIRPGPVGKFNIAVNIGLQNIDEPIDVDTQRARIQASFSDYYQWVDTQTWVHGNHVFQYGFDARYINFVHFRDDKVIGSIGLPVAEIGGLNFISIPASQRPGFIQPADVSRYDQFYSSLLGMVSAIPFMAVRDGQLQPLPVGSSLEADTTQQYYSFYFLDTWRLKPSLSASYGLYYGWTTPPIEKEGKQTIMALAANPKSFVNTKDFLNQKKEAALRGEIFNPDLAFVSINDSGQKAAYSTDRRNWSPRAALAWNPSYQNGLLGRLLGDRKTVFRGGYSLLWDRTNTVQTVIIPTLGIGFAQTISINAPLNAAGQPFRAGVDGPIPVKSFGAVKSPIIPGKPFSEILSFSVDPDIRVPHNHILDFTIQRALPANHFLEVGYIGRLGRTLYQSLNLQNTPYFFKDKASGQTFAQAFDAVATQLRAGVSAANVTRQPFFENQLPGVGTSGLVASQRTNIINGNLNNLFQFIDFRAPKPFNNLQSLDLFMRTSGGRSNYHGMVITLRKTYSKGLIYDFNYTLSKSLDQNGAIQNSAGEVPNSFDLNAGYAPSDFDLRHIATLNWVYDLPFGSNRHFSYEGWRNKLFGGWFTSGILQMRSGVPLLVFQGSQVFGGGGILGNAVGAIPTTDVSKFGNSIHTGVTGSNGIGTNSDPANKGTGLNLFGNPEAVFNSFRHVLLSQDTRGGRATLRMQPVWDLDLSVGKKTMITPGDNPVSITFSFDFFNAFNNVYFNAPNLSLTNKAAFGSISTQQNDSRRLQFGLRIDF